MITNASCLPQEKMDYKDKSKPVAESEKHSPPRIPGDWVKELFAPIFDFDAIVAAGKDGYQSKERKPLRVPILDPKTIQEVFERVHQRVVDAENRQTQEAEEQIESQLEKRIDPRQSCVWDTEELDTLRKVYKCAKGEISRLEVALREQKDYSESLESKVRKQSSEIEELKASLTEATRANLRLSIHRDSLLKDQAVLDVKLAALEEMWREIENEKVKAMEVTKTASMELNKERLERQKLQTDLLEAKENLLLKIKLAERNVHTKYEIEVSDLQEVIKDLTVTLVEERKMHSASKRGLEHLRHHFSSLPLDHILAPNAVVENEVEHIDHCSL